MGRPLICLTVTGKSLQEDLLLVNKYRKYIDVVELRGDFLCEDEWQSIRRFPSMVGLPCILTIRRKIDGGRYDAGEASRTVLFARALSFVDQDMSKGFAYVDFEENFRVASLQDAAIAYGLKIIRSLHDMKNPISNLAQKLEQIKVTDYEIPKIAFMPHSLDDVRQVFAEASKLKDSNHILLAMGPLGEPTRILGAKLKNHLTFTSPRETISNVSNLGHLDPITLCDTYHFTSIDNNTRVYGITGWPLVKTSSPELHNAGYRKHGMNAVYIPIRSENFPDVMEFAEAADISGLSVTIPHKEAAMKFADRPDRQTTDIGASNTLVHTSDGIWHAYNTDVTGFTRSLLEFTGTKNLAHKKVAIIGAGGASRAIAYAVKMLRGNACIFNRTLKKAADLASLYGFKAAALGPDSLDMLKKYSDIIIQTTSVGMNSDSVSNENNDPIFFYDFTGREMLFDIIYVPAVTPVMSRASKAGCKVCNGYDMLRYQGYQQFQLFTGCDY
jgi:3-dehydroquinate dehydratase/shikimate dehydrogenase